MRGTTLVAGLGRRGSDLEASVGLRSGICFGICFGISAAVPLPAGALVACGIRQTDAGTRVPAAQQSGAQRVVGEEEVVDRMLLTAFGTLSPAPGQRVRALLVLVLEGTPVGGGEGNRHSSRVLGQRRLLDSALTQTVRG